MAGKLDGVGKPRDWDKAMSAAYLRLIGLSQEEAAKGAGVGERSLQRWEVSDWWPKACEAAADRWIQQLGIECRTTVMIAVKNGDAQTAVKMLERIEKRLAPPRQQHEHTGFEGGPIETQNVHVYLPENHRNRVSSDRRSTNNRAPSRAPGSVSRNGS